MSDQTETTDIAERSDEIAELIQTPGSSIVPMIERAQLDQMIVTARNYPRVPSRCIDAITALARLDRLAAEECVYALPRGGKPIIGPSIRFAEIVKQAWGNCSVSSYIIGFSREDGWIEAEGRFHDLQTNAETKRRVRSRITDKRGRVFTDDMIIVTGNAAASKAMRNCILDAVPRPAWRAGYEAALAIAIDHKGETFIETRDKALKSFGQFGVTSDQVLGALGLRAVEDLAGEHIPVLRGMFQTLKNGEETVESLFDPRKGRPFEAVKDPLKDDEPDDNEAGKATGERSPAPSKVAEPAESAPPAAASPANAAPAASEPGNEEEYRAHALKWIGETQSFNQLEVRWKNERRMRTEAEVSNTAIAELIEARKARAAEIKAVAS